MSYQAEPDCDLEGRVTPPIDIGSSWVAQSKDDIDAFQKRSSHPQDETVVVKDVDNVLSARFWRAPEMQYVGAVLLAALLFGFTLGFTGNTEQGLRATGQMTKDEFMWFSAVVGIAGFVGAMAAAPIADGVGRQKCLIVTGLFYVVGYAMLSFCDGFVLLFVGRSLTGVASGMVCFVVPLYIAEVAKASRRGALGASIQLAIVIGIFGTYGLATIITVPTDVTSIPQDYYDYLEPGDEPPQRVCDYKTFTLLLSIFAILFTTLCCFLPDTPRWYFMKSRVHDGEDVLQRLRGDGVEFQKEKQDLLVASSVAAAATSSDEAGGVVKVESLWRDFKKQLLIGIMLVIFQQLSGAVTIYFYLTKILEKNDVANPDVYSTINMLVQIFFTAVAVVLMDKLGRRPLLIFSFAGLMVAMAGFSSRFLFDVTGTGGAILSFGSAVVFTIALSLGVGPIPLMILPELFPTCVRGKASSIAVGIQWLMVFAITFSFDLLIDLVGEAATFGTYSSCCLLGLIFVWIFIPETKGKSLEEINVRKVQPMSARDVREKSD